MTQPTKRNISQSVFQFDAWKISSKHAKKNYQRRGVKNEAANAVYAHADICINRGRGMMMLKISKAKLQIMGGKTPEGVSTDRLKNLCLLVANDNTIVTVIRPRKGKYKVGRTVGR
jgi:hypothetical protein